MSRNTIDPLANYLPVNLHDAYELVEDCFNAKVVPNLISSPGVGKSSLIHQIAEKWEYLVVDVRLSTIDPTELNGFPHIWEVDGRKVASYIPMDMFPIVGKTLPTNPTTGRAYKGWMLFLDEFNAGTLLVQAAAYKLVLDRMVGMYKLDDRCVMATAGNLTTDKAIVNRLGTAMQSRVSHLPIKVCTETWNFWAAAAGIDHRILSYIKRFPEHLHKFDPNHTDLTFECPRTWEFMSKLTKKYDPIPISKLPLMAGTIGLGAARQYIAFTQVYGKIPTIEEIVRNPSGVTFPEDDPSVIYAMAGLVGYHLKESNAKELLQFITRLGIDHQVTALRQSVAREYDLLQNIHIQDWYKVNAQELIQRK